VATDPALVVAVSPNTPTLPISAASLPLPAGASTAANQTTVGSQTTKINDGTNTAAVKAASTAPVATDQALVVAVSPNTPTLPVSIAATVSVSAVAKSGSSANLQDVNSRLAALVASADTDAPTFTASVSGQANTASSDSIAIESGATKIVRIRRIIIMHPGSQTTAGLRVLQLLRTTTAGTAGVIVPAPADTGDTAFSGIVRAKPTGLGTAGTVLLNIPVFVPTALAAFTPIILDMDALGLAKSFKGIAGITNGFSLRDPGAAGGANFAATVIFTEEAT
jgi:hypothetical protein